MRISERLIELDLAEPHKGQVARLVAAAWISVQAAWRLLQNRSAINRMSEMDDFQLNDIGLTRPEVNAILRTTALHEDPSWRMARCARSRAQEALRR